MCNFFNEKNRLIRIFFQDKNNNDKCRCLFVDYILRKRALFAFIVVVQVI